MKRVEPRVEELRFEDSPLALAIIERQRYILGTLRNYTLYTIVAAIIGFGLSTVLDASQNQSTNEFLLVIQNTRLSLVGIITILLNLFSALMLWFFVMWAVSFVPFIAFQAQKASDTIRMEIRTKPMRWLPLYSSTFLPMIIFAFIWLNSSNTEHQWGRIPNLLETVQILVGGLAVWGVLWLITSIIPKKLVALHLSMLSTLLFASLFVAFGIGYTAVAYCTLFGILFYMAFTFTNLEEIAKRIAVFDLDPATAEKIVETIEKSDKMRIEHEEIKIDRMQLRQEQKVQDLQHERAMNSQLNKVRTQEQELAQLVHATVINTLLSKAVALSEMCRIYAAGLNQKLPANIQAQIDKLESEAKDSSPKELMDKMMAIYSDMNTMMKEVPASMDDLRAEMKKIMSEARQETLKLGSGTTDAPKD